MSVLLSDILKLPSLRGATVVAGATGLNRAITSISVLESINADTLGFDFPGFSSSYGGEIMITAFMEAKNDVEMQCTTLRRIHKEGEIGLIVFYVGSIIPFLDQRLIDLADELDMTMIVMPERRLELRYSDVICEVMEAIINDRHANTYFATEVIEHISHIENPQRSMNSVLSVIRYRVQCSVFLIDELGGILNAAEWPNGRELPVQELLSALETCPTPLGQVVGIPVDDKLYYVEREQIQNANALLSILTVKEKNDLTVDCCKQIKYIIRTYLNLWTEHYGQLDTKQLISAIINDEPEKMRRIANVLKVNIKNFSCAYFFYSTGEEHEFSQIVKARGIIRDFISVYNNSFLAEVFDETVVVFADRTRELINKDLPLLLREMDEQGLHFHVALDGLVNTTQDVKSFYWLCQNGKKYASILFPAKAILTDGELTFAMHVKDICEREPEKNAANIANMDRLLTQKSEKDLLDTMAVFLLDSGLCVTSTAELLGVHKNTVKYRLKMIEDVLGYKITRMPEMYELYLLTAIRRLQTALL